MSDAIAFDSNAGGIQLTNTNDMMGFAKSLLNSGLAPKHLKSPQQVVICLQSGSELGLKPMQSMRYIAPINGVPCVWGEAAKAIVLRTGQVEEWEDWWELDGIRLDGDPIDFSDGLTAVTRLRRKSGGEVIRRFSVADARRARLWGKSGPWTQYPQRMLRVRPMALAMRDLFADALCGLGIAEEVKDIPTDRSPSTTTLDGLGGLKTVDVEAKEVPPDRDQELQMIAEKAAFSPLFSQTLADKLEEFFGVELDHTEGGQSDFQQTLTGLVAHLSDAEVHHLATQTILSEEEG